MTILKTGLGSLMNGSFVRPREGDLVVSARGHWDTPRLVIKVHETARALLGILFEDEVKYVHYKHLEVVNENR